MLLAWTAYSVDSILSCPAGHYPSPNTLQVCFQLISNSFPTPFQLEEALPNQQGRNRPPPCTIPGCRDRVGRHVWRLQSRPCWCCLPAHHNAPGPESCSHRLLSVRSLLTMMLPDRSSAPTNSSPSAACPPRSSGLARAVGSSSRSCLDGCSSGPPDDPSVLKACAGESQLDLNTGRQVFWAPQDVSECGWD